MQACTFSKEIHELYAQHNPEKIADIETLIKMHGANALLAMVRKKYHVGEPLPEEISNDEGLGKTKHEWAMCLRIKQAVSNQELVAFVQDHLVLQGHVLWPSSRASTADPGRTVRLPLADSRIPLSAPYALFLAIVGGDHAACEILLDKYFASPGAINSKPFEENMGEAAHPCAAAVRKPEHSSVDADFERPLQVISALRGRWRPRCYWWQGMTPLMVAAAFNRLRVIEVLRLRGADPRVKYGIHRGFGRDGMRAVDFLGEPIRSSLPGASENETVREALAAVFSQDTVSNEDFARIFADDWVPGLLVAAHQRLAFAIALFTKVGGAMATDTDVVAHLVEVSSSILITRPTTDVCTRYAVQVGKFAPTFTRMV